MINFAHMKIRLVHILVLLLALGLSLPADAQCAMCKAVAETSRDGGSSVADGLNQGILYLMAIPYVLMGAVGFALHRHRKSKSIR